MKQPLIFLLFLATISATYPIYAAENTTYYQSHYGSQKLTFSYNNPSHNTIDCRKFHHKNYKNIASRATSIAYKYTANQFKHYFEQSGYTEKQILNQQLLYLSDEFVQLAKTYPEYENAIKQLREELKNLSSFKKFLRTLAGTYCRGLTKRVE